MMNKSEKLIDKCLEIEGLLSLISQQRGENIEMQTSGFKEIHRLLLDKAETLLDEIRQLDVTPLSDDTTSADSMPYEKSQDADKNTILPPPLPEEEEDESAVKVVPPPIPLPHEEIPAETEPTEIGQDQIAITDESPEETEIPETDEEYEYEELEPAKPRKIQFSVNDKFRFRRELFNFSDEEMAEAIDVACQMNTVEEIEDYFYNDLCFEPDNEDVMDFMKILTSSIK